MVNPACGAICYYADVRARSFSPETIYRRSSRRSAARARFRGVIWGRSQSRVLTEPLTLIIGQWYWFRDGTFGLLLPYRLFRSSMTIVTHSTSSFLVHLHMGCPGWYRLRERVIQAGYTKLFEFDISTTININILNYYNIYNIYYNILI